MLRVYVLEDETNILRYMIGLLEEIPFVHIVGYSASLKRAESEIPKLEPDVILADIQLRDGVSFKLFSSMDYNAQIIFITAYNQYAIEALNLGAIAYLLKPVDPTKIQEALDKCYQKTNEFRFNKSQLDIAEQFYSSPIHKRRIALKTFDFTQLVQVSDILYLHGDKGYSTFCLHDGSSIVVSKVLKHYEGILPQTDFIRCHQSFLINVNFIVKYFKDGQIEMKDGKMIQVSSRKRELVQAFIERLN